MKNNTFFWTTLIFGFLAAWLLFKDCGKPTVKTPEPILVPIKDQVKTVENNEAKSKKVIDSLNKENSKQVAIANDLKGKLKAEQNNSRLIERTLNAYLNQVTPEQPRDTNDYENNVRDLITSSQRKDSLCNSLTTNLEGQIRLKDNVITEKDILYSRLRSSFDLSIAQQQTLIDYSKKLKKEIKAKNRSALVWKIISIGAGVFILQNQVRK